MNPIRDFFKKKLETRKVEKNFKKAGPGHRLTEASNSGNVQHARPVVDHGPRHPPTDVARKAAEAALARTEQNKTGPVNWSLSAVRAQAKKELETEKQQQQNISLNREGPKEVNQESCPYLTVSGVYFTCPMVSPEVLTKAEIEVNIREFLNKQLEEERGLSACLIIHSCNKNKEKVKLGVETIVKYLTNILQNPTEEKYRKIRINNRVFQERLSTLEGVFDFLLACGFVQQTLEQDGKSEDYFVYAEENLENFENLDMLKDALLNAEPIRPVLDRNKKVLMPSQASEGIMLPNDFFNLTAEELRREQEERIMTTELLTTLRTKEMRERDKNRENRTYKYTLIRIRFPDGIILQGTFNVREKLIAVREFIVDNLHHPEWLFHLVVSGGAKLIEDENTLLELQLVPAVVLNLLWANEESGETAYLLQETMSLLQNM